jgi:hypothetical protein
MTNKAAGGGSVGGVGVICFLPGIDLIGMPSNADVGFGVHDDGFGLLSVHAKPEPCAAAAAVAGLATTVALVFSEPVAGLATGLMTTVALVFSELGGG